MNDDLLDLFLSPATRPLVEAAGFRLVVHHPNYGDQGRPYTLVATKGGDVLKEPFWTSSEALDRRDELLEQDFEQVIIIGLPTIVAGGCAGGQGP